jgi:flavin reductase (DIM6/NTAB) family NADH-FMN oxidoreductase RutF
MAKVQLDRIFRPVYPSPAGLISSVAADGTPNIITLGETFNVSIDKPVVLGLAITPERYSYELIRDSGEFVVNLPTADMAEVVDRCGTISGREVGDKFAYAGLTPLPAAKVRAPLIAECPVNIECRLIDIIPAGDHDLFRGEAVAEHVDEQCLDANGNIAVERLNPLIYALGQYWSVGEKLGFHGCTRRKPSDG